MVCHSLSAQTFAQAELTWGLPGGPCTCTATIDLWTKEQLLLLPEHRGWVAAYGCPGAGQGGPQFVPLSSATRTELWAQLPLGAAVRASARLDEVGVWPPSPLLPFLWDSCCRSHPKLLWLKGISRTSTRSGAAGLPTLSQATLSQFSPGFSAATCDTAN